MKTIKLFTLISVLLVLNSCDSLLDVDTKHALPQEKIKTVAGCESLIIGYMTYCRILIIPGET